MTNSFASGSVPLDYGGPVDRPFEAFPESALDATIVDRFEKIAGRFPDRLAIQDLSNSLTYRELAALVAKIGAAVAAATVGCTGPIGILLEQDARYPAAMLGVLAAGGAYAALDPSQPAARNRAIIELAGVSAIISAGALAEQTGAMLSSLVPIIDIDTLVGLPMPRSAIRPVATDLAYILFTSGSAGIPKGVPHSHSDILHYMLQYTNALHLSSEDRLTLFHPLSVSAGTRDVYAALLTGASLHILPPIDLKQSGLVQEIQARGITIYHSVPTLLRRLTERQGTHERLESVRIACLSSDRVEWSDIEACRRTFCRDVLVYMSLASTETHVRCHWFVDDALRQTTLRPPVGRPLPNRELSIVDEGGNSVAVGEEGEILIKSRYIARGYWNSPELTMATFGRDRSDASLVVFRTGDLGRQRADGLIEFIGRKDDLIKLHGNRIEPAEIESALVALQGVSDAAVVVRYSENGTPTSLVAYVVLKPENGDLLRANFSRC
jgi:amino acid adenylation domain-containing protein